ncbi:protein of unknown function [Pseudomonas sp. JV551A1]|uniref:Uncharacterized protein n=1 Tax=Pseudomonas inefficax TaxID=2078786 RepID=A0AAQ1SS22_9PSED|nr:protein of unknown function [Pseudomonas sp. JV551A1]SPO59500.1 protein of unknown function [Pseudomonas inefficax]
MGAALAANTGAAGAMHRVGFFAAKAAPTGYADRLRIQLSVKLGFSEVSYALKRCFLQASPPSNIPQKAIILPAQTFNFVESYSNATFMYARTTFLTPIILPRIALGTAPA